MTFWIWGMSDLRARRKVMWPEVIRDDVVDDDDVVVDEKDESSPVDEVACDLCDLKMAPPRLAIAASNEADDADDAPMPLPTPMTTQLLLGVASATATLLPRLDPTLDRRR